MGKFIKGLFKVVLLVLLVVIAYAVALAFHVLPASLTPQSLMPEQYKAFKANLSKEASSNSANAGMSKAVNDYLDGVEKAYSPSKEAPSSTPAEAAPMSPTQDMGGATMPSTPSTDGTTSTDTTPGTSTTPAPAEEPNAVTKAKEAVDNYQNSVDQQQQKLDQL